MQISTLAVLLLAIASSMSFPIKAPCNKIYLPNEVSSFSATSMNQAEGSQLKDGTGGGCVISGMPAQVNPCNSYEITVTSNVGRGQLVHAAQGSLKPSKSSSSRVLGKCALTGDRDQITTGKYVWTAPNGSPSGQAVGVMCATQDGAGIFAAVPLVIGALNGSAPTFDAGCPTDCLGPGCAQINSSIVNSASVFISIVVAMVSMILLQ